MSNGAISLHRADGWWTAYVLIPLLLATGAGAAYVSPVAVEGVARMFGLSATYSGAIITFEMIFSFFTALGLANYLNRKNAIRISLISSIIAGISQVMSAYHIGLFDFCIYRALAGLSCGALYAVACFWAGQHAHGVRLLSIAFITASIIYGAGLFVWPAEMLRYGLIALYGPLAALAAITALALRTIGAPVLSDEISMVVESRHVSKSAIWVLLAMCALANGGLQMIWTFTERTATIRGFDLDLIGTLFGITALFNVLGSFGASLLDRRFGVFLPLVGGALGGALSGFLIGSSHALVGLAAGMFVYGVSAFFVLPYLLSAGAHFDATGRTVTLASGTVYLAGAISPVIGGAISDGISVGAVGWTACLACIGAAACARILKPAID